IFGDSWQRTLQAFAQIEAPAVPGAAPVAPVHLAPEKLQELQKKYVEEAGQLWAEGLQAPPPPADKRFAGAGWAQNPLAAFSAAASPLDARTLMALADAMEGDEKTRAQVRFGVEQWVAAMAPSNFLAFNAEAQRKAIETKGESIAKGMLNLMHD